MNDFICAVMTDKPKNIFKFARYWFKHSLPPLEELATAQATAPKAAAQDSENDPDLVQNIDHVKAVGTRQLLARIYAVLDADSDKVLTWEEFQSSPFYGILPDAVWSKMDRDASGGVTPVEFFAFMKVIEADEGKLKFHETIANFVQEAGMNVMDLLPPVDDLPAQINALPSQDVRDFLFKEAIHQGMEEERDFIYKKEMQHSKIGVLMLPFWDQLDEVPNPSLSLPNRRQLGSGPTPICRPHVQDADGKIHAKEWNAFFDKVEASAVGKEMAAKGESLLVDLFLDGGYNIMDVTTK